MAYEPTNWQAGDIVTSAKLNKIEQGIARHDIVEGIVDEESGIVTLNKTWQEIWDNNYTNIMVIYDGGTTKGLEPIQRMVAEGKTSPYAVLVGNSINPTPFTCDSPDDYPSYDQSSQGQAVVGDQTDLNVPEYSAGTP